METTKITGAQVRKQVKAAGLVPAFWARNRGTLSLLRTTWREVNSYRIAPIATGGRA